MTHTSTEEPEALPTPESVMDQAQVFASAWSLYGSGSILEPEDSLEVAQEAKDELRTKLRTLLGAQSGQQVPSAYLVDPSDGGDVMLISVEYEKLRGDGFRSHGWVVSPLYTHPAPALELVRELRAELAEEKEAADNWRRLALQFDNHRLQALWHLKAVVNADNSTLEAKAAEDFLKAGPLDGEAVLAQRIAALAATQPAAQGVESQNLYYLQDARHHAMVGNCPSFWREGGGYTTNLDEAERFTFEVAMKQHKCRETDLPWLCTEVDKLRRPTVDCQYMPRGWDAQRAALASQANGEDA